LGDTWELGSDLDIALEPQSAGVEVGAAAQLHVVASGTGPFTYQWMKEGVPLADGGRVSGATSDTLVIDPAEAGDSGRYSVVIGNACGPVQSREAKLVVPPVPAEAKSLLASYDKASGTVAVTYTLGCDALDHTIHYGPLEGVSTYGYSGAVCPIGTSGSASFDAGPGNVFFLVVGVHGGLEGSYGLGSAGERPQDAVPSSCTLPQGLGPACE
jgi:hypothetical protein